MDFCEQLYDYTVMGIVFLCALIYQLPTLYLAWLGGSLTFTIEVEHLETSLWCRRITGDTQIPSVPFSCDPSQMWSSFPAQDRITKQWIDYVLWQSRDQWLHPITADYDNDRMYISGQYGLFRHTAAKYIYIIHKRHWRQCSGILVTTCIKHIFN